MMATARRLLPLADAFSRYAKFGYERPGVALMLRLWGVCITLAGRRRVAPEPCDFLVLSPTQPWYARVEGFVEALRRMWPRTRHLAVPRLRRMFGARQWLAPTSGVSLKWALLSGHANYLLEKYRPKVVVTFSETDMLSFFLKLEAERRGMQVVNIAHAVLTTSHLKALFCFDYYFVYGPSSVENARMQPVRFGSTNLVEAGSIMVRPDDVLELNRARNTVLFFSTFLYGGSDDYSRRFDALALRSMGVVAAWARQTPGRRLLVKIHPEENPDLVCRLFAGIENVAILPRSTSLREALRPASLSLGVMTNAAIESALMNRPYRDVLDRDFCPNYLSLEEYFGPRVQSAEELSAAVDQVFTHYDEALQNCARFARHHLADRGDSRRFIAGCLDAIVRGKADFAVEHVGERVDVLKAGGFGG